MQPRLELVQNHPLSGGANLAVKALAPPQSCLITSCCEASVAPSTHMVLTVGLPPLT